LIRTTELVGAITSPCTSECTILIYLFAFMISIGNFYSGFSLLSLYMFVVKKPRSKRPFCNYSGAVYDWFALTDDMEHSICDCVSWNSTREVTFL